MIEAILLIFIIIGLLVISVKKPKNFPPGPMQLPIVGHWPLLDRHSPQNTFDLLYKKYGDVNGFIVPNFKVISVSGFEMAKEAFYNEDCLGRPDVCLLRDRFSDRGQYGVLFTDGDGWKSNRRFTLHHFRNLGFGRKNHEAVVMYEAEALAEEIKSLGSRPFNITEIFSAASINITWALLGSDRYTYSDPVLRKLAENINEIIHAVKCFGSVAVSVPVLRYIFPKTFGYASVTRGSKGIMEFTQRAIREHSASREKDNPRDFIDIYLQELENNKGKDPHFSEQQLEGICMDLLCAGADTSSAVMGFLILFLCLRKELQEKIYQEIKDNVGENRVPSYEDRENLVLTEATIMEVLRFRTPAPTVVPHRVLRDTTIGGYSIPKDAVLYVNLKSIFMDPTYWKDPENFRPERFVTEDGKLRRDERMIPFGKGKRSCLGETIAKMTTFILIATLVQRFSFSLPSNMPVPDTEGVPGFTMAPPAYMIIATPRK